MMVPPRRCRAVWLASEVGSLRGVCGVVGAGRWRSRGARASEYAGMSVGSAARTASASLVAACRAVTPGRAREPWALAAVAVHGAQPASPLWVRGDTGSGPSGRLAAPRVTPDWAGPGAVERGGRSYCCMVASVDLWSPWCLIAALYAGVAASGCADGSLLRPVRACGADRAARRVGAADRSLGATGCAVVPQFGGSGFRLSSLFWVCASPPRRALPAALAAPALPASAWGLLPRLGVPLGAPLAREVELPARPACCASCARRARGGASCVWSVAP